MYAMLFFCNSFGINETLLFVLALLPDRVFGRYKFQNSVTVMFEYSRHKTICIKKSMCSNEYIFSVKQ